MEKQNLYIHYTKTEKFPQNLIDAETVAEHCGVEVEKINELTNMGYLPHYRLDESKPLYHKSEVKEWVGKNLTQ